VAANGSSRIGRHENLLAPGPGRAGPRCPSAAATPSWRANGNGGDAPRYKLAKAESGPLVAVVSATGTLNPVVSVQVGSQVSGQIKEILVDFNSPVKENQLIARIDPETFQYRVRQAEADLEATRAAVGVQQRGSAARQGQPR
jgi:HlyD family secretion protein